MCPQQKTEASGWLPPDWPGTFDWTVHTVFLVACPVGPIVLTWSLCLLKNEEKQKPCCLFYEGQVLPIPTASFRVHLDCRIASFLSSSFLSCEASVQAAAPHRASVPNPVPPPRDASLPAHEYSAWLGHTRGRWSGHPVPPLSPHGPKGATPSTGLQAFTSFTFACSDLSSPTLQTTSPLPSLLSLKAHLKCHLHPEIPF